MSSRAEPAQLEDRKRSRSPYREKNDRDVKFRRSRSPSRRRHHHHHHHRRHHHRLAEEQLVRLPYKQSPLHKREYNDYKALFADYLDVQKQIDVSTLSDDEVKGRWKSFMGKWNRGELAEGWYDPSSRNRADKRAVDAPITMAWADEPRSKRSLPEVHASKPDDDDDDGYGPALPPGLRHGPHVPSFQDLQQRREMNDEDRSIQRADRTYERKQERNTQKERLEELVPRAEAGSRERQLEKRREIAASNKSFADAKDEGAAEVPESDLLGASGVDEYKAEIKANQRRKNEREIRKEEVLRAREAEREERLAEHRKKEDKTMDMLKALAAQRYGGGRM